MTERYTGWSVTVRYYDDELFGGTMTSDEMAQYDVPASERRFAELAEAAIRQQYPGIEIEMQYGVHSGHGITVAAPQTVVDSADSDIETETETDILEITGEIFEHGDWAVTNG